jgi:hypothetical protein
MGFREKWAGKFGRIEHEAGRLIPIPIIITGALIIIGLNEPAFYTTILALVIWLIYLVSHRLEKFFYGKGLRR